MSAGFIRLQRSAILGQLVLDKKAWSLLGVIAGRARWNDGPNLYDLKIGEALVGDYKEAKLTRQEYRGALQRLEHKWLQITTHPTSEGTIARLTQSSVFDLSQPKHNQNTTKKQPPNFIGETAAKQPSSNHPATIQQPLTNKERRKEGNNDDSRVLCNSLAEGQPSDAGKSSSSNSDWIKEAEKDELFPQFAAFAKTLNEKGWKTWRSKHSPKPKPKPATKSPRLPEPKRVQPPMDPIAEADFQRRLAEWKAKGRPLGEWSEISMGGNSHAER